VVERTCGAKPPDIADDDVADNYALAIGVTTDGGEGRSEDDEVVHGIAERRR
jgi:hypothetical protein